MSNNAKPFDFGNDRRSALAFAYELWFNVENVRIENNNWTVIISKPDSFEAKETVEEIKDAAPAHPLSLEPSTNIPEPEKQPVIAAKPKRDRAGEKARRKAREAEENAKRKPPAKSRIEPDPEPEIEDEEDEEEDNSEPESVEEMSAPNDFTEPVKTHHIQPQSAKKSDNHSKPKIRSFAGLSTLRLPAKTH